MCRETRPHLCRLALLFAERKKKRTRWVIGYAGKWTGANITANTSTPAHMFFIFRYVVLLWQDVQVRFWLQNNSLKSVWSNTVFDHGLGLVVIIILIYICSYVYVIWTKVKIYATILYSRNFVEANTQQEKSVHDMIWWLDKTNLICFVLVKKHLFINFPSPRLAIHPVHNIELTVKLTGCRSLQSL